MAVDDGAKKRNFAEGLLVRDLAAGAIAVGQAAGEDVVLVRRGDEFFAVGANCTHYHGELSQGLVVGDTLRCPLHMLVSASVPEKRCVPPRSTRYRAGTWKELTTGYLFERSFQNWVENNCAAPLMVTGPLPRW